MSNQKHNNSLLKYTKQELVKLGENPECSKIPDIFCSSATSLPDCICFSTSPSYQNLHSSKWLSNTYHPQLEFNSFKWGYRPDNFRGRSHTEQDSFKLSPHRQSFVDGCAVHAATIGKNPSRPQPKYQLRYVNKRSTGTSVSHTAAFTGTHLGIKVDVETGMLKEDLFSQNIGSHLYPGNNCLGSQMSYDFITNKHEDVSLQDNEIICRPTLENTNNNTQADTIRKLSKENVFVRSTEVNKCNNLTKPKSSLTTITNTQVIMPESEETESAENIQYYKPKFLLNSSAPQFNPWDSVENGSEQALNCFPKNSTSTEIPIDEPEDSKLSRGVEQMSPSLWIHRSCGDSVRDMNGMFESLNMNEFHNGQGDASLTDVVHTSSSKSSLIEISTEKQFKLSKDDTNVLKSNQGKEVDLPSTIPAIIHDPTQCSDSMLPYWPSSDNLNKHCLNDSILALNDHQKQKNQGNSNAPPTIDVIKLLSPLESQKMLMQLPIDLKMMVRNVKPTKEMLERTEAVATLNGLKNGQMTVEHLVRQLQNTALQHRHKELLACILKMHLQDSHDSKHNEQVCKIPQNTFSPHPKSILFQTNTLNTFPFGTRENFPFRQTKWNVIANNDRQPRSNLTLGPLHHQGTARTLRYRKHHGPPDGTNCHQYTFK